jgi:hypothetical protein
LRGAGTDVAVVQADAGDPERLRAAPAPLFTTRVEGGIEVLRRLHARAGAHAKRLDEPRDPLRMSSGMSVISFVVAG